MRSRTTLPDFAAGLGRPAIRSGNRWRFAAWAMIALSLVGLLFAMILDRGFWSGEAIVKGPFPKEGGVAYSTPVDVPPHLWALRPNGDETSGSARSSTLQILEDGTPLPLAHSLHNTIREEGHGRYSHWGRGVYFATTDNSDPNTNGRTYAIRYTIQLAGPLITGLIVLGALGAAILLRRPGRGAPMLLGGMGTSALHLSAMVLAVGCVAGVAATLAVLWLTGRSQYLAVGGYLPWSDALGWYHGSLLLLHEGQTTEWSTRRVLNPALLSGLMRFSGESLQVTLIVRAALIAIASFLFARAVMVRYGLPAAIVAALLPLLFFVGFADTTMSEWSGLFFGLLGTTLLVSAAGDGRPLLFAIGIFAVSLGLQCRPGPMLVLPLLVLWSGFGFRGARRFAIVPLLLSAGGIVAAMAVAYIAQKFYSPEGLIPFGNFSTVLYGLAKGGEPWYSFHTDFPDLSVELAKDHLPPMGADQAESIIAFRRAFALIAADPRPLLHGMADFLHRWAVTQFLYVHMEISALRLPAFVLAAIGGLWALRPGRNRVEAMTVVCVLGCALSACFIYWSVDGYRTYAALVPIDGLLAALGIHALLRLISGMAPTAPAPSTHPTVLVLIAAALVVIYAQAALGPVKRPAAIVGDPSCPAGQQQATIDLGRSSPSIRLTKDQGHDFVPTIAEHDFLADRNFSYVDFADALASLKASDRFVIAYDLGIDRVVSPGGNSFWLVARNNIIPEDEGVYALCVTSVDLGPKLNWVKMMSVERAERVTRAP